MASKVNWDDILLEWSYRLPKGYPTMKDGKFTSKKELRILREVMAEYGFDKPLNLELKGAMLQEAKTVQDIQTLITSMTLRPDQISKLYNTIKTFTLYEPIKNTLLKKTPGLDDPKKLATKKGIYKQFTQQIKSLLEDLPGNALLKFQKYLQDKLDGQAVPVTFPSTNGAGKFKFPQPVAPEVGAALAKHTAQDEGKKGVGMGELLMTLIYDNITQPAGKGDVFLEGVGELEVKGWGAILGKGRPEDFPFDTSWLESYGLEGGVWPGRTQGFAKYLIEVFAKPETDKEKFIQSFKDALRKSPLYADSTHIDKYVTADSFTTPQRLSKCVGILNFFIYHKEEEFKCFIAHDYGTKRAGNTGQYVFAQGSAEAMAGILFNAQQAQFQLIGARNIKPRLTVGSTAVGDELSEEYTDEDYL